MFKFMVVDKGAASYIISDRFMQTIEFHPGQCLADFITSFKDFSAHPKLAFIKSNGLYILNVTEASDDLIVFDLEQSGLFKGLSVADSLRAFQCVLRFSIRYWNQMKLGRADKIIQHSTKAVVFPFQFKYDNAYRISIEREPDRKRQAKRPGNHLLVYKFATSEGQGAEESPSTTNFRKSLEGLADAKAKIRDFEESGVGQPEVCSYSVTSLDLVPKTPIPGLSFDDWLRFLTEKQKNFVSADSSFPQRIEGPAGTGKTLCLVLKCISTLRRCELNRTEHHSIFIAHSEATRKAIFDLFEISDKSRFHERERYNSLQSVQISTLQRTCAGILGKRLSESELLDIDAMESKYLQSLYIVEAIEEVKYKSLPTFKPILSNKFYGILNGEDMWTLAEMFRHEISVLIKGRAEESYERYVHLHRPTYCLPIENDHDKAFAFLVFQNYTQRLISVAQFDTDDITISTLNQLNSPIWRRRKKMEGFDSIFIDETHLFNLNELSVFHHIARPESSTPIVYSVDKAQAIGDHGLSNDILDTSLMVSRTGENKTSLTIVDSIFRCSPEIVSLAFSVTSSGATLFTNFDDPLALASSAFTEEEERKCADPIYWSVNTDASMIKASFEHAEAMRSSIGTITRGNILLVAFTEQLFNEMVRYGKDNSVPLELIRRRGDVELLNKARNLSRFLLSTPDYVGGLEFEGVILVGVDNGRVPPEQVSDRIDSYHFLNYSAHNRLYVAITRAKYRIEIFGTTERGLSPILKKARDAEFLKLG